MSPRCLPIRDAATYVGLKPTQLRTHGPKPLRIGRRCVWDVQILDAWIDTLRGTADMTEQQAAEAEWLED